GEQPAADEARRARHQNFYSLQIQDQAPTKKELSRYTETISAHSARASGPRSLARVLSATCASVSIPGIVVATAGNERQKRSANCAGVWPGWRATLPTNRPSALAQRSFCSSLQRLRWSCWSKRVADEYCPVRKPKHRGVRAMTPAPFAAHRSNRPDSSARWSTRLKFTWTQPMPSRSIASAASSGERADRPYARILPSLLKRSSSARMLPSRSSSSALGPCSWYRSI